MEDKEINITYETIFDLLRREKNRAELQKLGDSFFVDVNDYIKEKYSILKDQQMKVDMSASAEKEKTQKQIENINSMLKGLFERRQQKIVDMAIIKSRIPPNTVNYSPLLKEEKEMFDELVLLLNEFKEKVLLKLITKPEVIESKQEEKRPEESESKELKTEEETKPEIKAEEDEDTKLVRFIHSVPRFVGRHLEVYGPFEDDDTANLPEEIADILIKKGRAEEIKK